MVNGSLLLGHGCNRLAGPFRHICCAKAPVEADCACATRNVFDCVGVRVVCFACAGERKGSRPMIEMVTAFMGLVGAGIFIAHAFEGVLSRT